MQQGVIPRVIHWFETHRVLSIIVLAASIVLVLYPRFNRHDIAIIRPFVGLQEGEVSPDIQNYINFTEYFKHKLPLDSVGVPYNYRPALPFVASLLPTDSLLGMIIVNIAALCLSTVSIFLVLQKERFSFGWCIAGCLLYIISFPVFYYVSSGYLDSSALLIICLIVLATVYRNYLLLPLLFLIGALVKEVVIVTLPFVLIFMYQDSEKSLSKKYGLLLLSVGCYVAGYFYARSTFATISNFMWSPGVSLMMENLRRPKTYLSFLISFGIVGILGMLQLASDIKNTSGSVIAFLCHRDAPYFFGLFASLALCVYAVVAAYADGRFIWTAYPFMIPLALRYLVSRQSRTQVFL
jgi:hypothetical protein